MPQHTYRIDAKTTVMVTDMLRRSVGAAKKAPLNRRMHFAIISGRQSASFPLSPRAGTLLESVIGRLVKRARKAASEAAKNGAGNRRR